VGYLEKSATIDVDAFAWVDNYVGRRKSVRVMIEKPIKARIKSLKRELELDVIDVSTHGICLEGSATTGLPPNEQVEVVLPIPQNDGVRNLTMRGALRYISKPDAIHRRYHIVLHHDPKREQIIANFVAREEMRILKEIRELADQKL
jgi:hypothetical protein